MQSYQQTKRRKKRVLQPQVTKTVTVVRGKSGYGFTISGQNPCVLSCIVPGSPAQVAGLKAGDLLYVVNGHNVGTACHDDVVRMVGLSTGALDLQVAENYNSSDSSDEDYLPRSKSRYPNRVRTHESRAERTAKHERISSSKQSANKHCHHNHSGEEESDFSSSLTSQEDQAWANLATAGKALCELKKQDLTDPSGKQNTHCSQPVMSAAKTISSAAAVVKRVPPVKDYLQHTSRHSHKQNGCTVEVAKCQGCELAAPRDCQVSSEAPSRCTDNVLKAIVGYIGSIETPSSHTRPHQRLQALRNAVKRLRLEKRVHTLVLMEVTPSGVLLTNALGKQLALYPSDRIAYSGICPDDEQFFGLVTLSTPDSSHLTGGDCLRRPNSSCHIFMIEPDLSPQSAHVQQAPMCQVGRAAGSKTGHHDQCPMSATCLIRGIANLYRDKPSRRLDSDFIQSQAFAHPTVLSEHCHRSSENGLEMGRDGRPLEQNEQVCVVEMSSGREPLHTSSPLVGAGSSLNNLSPEMDDAAGPSASSCLVDRTPGAECWPQACHAVNRLTPQAMPDPACFQVSTPDCPDLNLAVRSTENLKQNMQRYLEARQQLLVEQNCIVGSDAESYIGDHVLSLSVSDDGHAVLETGNSGQWKQPEKAFVFTVPTNPPVGSLHHKAARSAFHLLRSPSAPLGRHSKPVTVDLETVGKLSPRAFPHSPPLSSVFCRSPSAPLFPHRDSDEDCESEDDPYILQILEQFNQDWTATMNDDNRRFSEGFHMTKKRLEEPTGVLGVHKWTKTGSFRKTGAADLKQSYSQSLETLAVGENAGSAAESRLITACSTNNIANRDHGAKSKAGRVATWAVHFDKLLQDTLGLDVFTEFLENEYSAENIRFWKACEQFRGLTSDQQRKVQAREIFDRHLATKASDPINVDSVARAHTEKMLDKPTAQMFDVAQQQIVQLMRLDSYSRFLKSDLYKKVLLKEMEDNTQAGQEEVTKSKPAVSKQGNGKENGGKRRRSILPWKYQKSVKVASDTELNKLNHKVTADNDMTSLKQPMTSTATASTNNLATLRKTAAGLSIDLSTMRREVFQQKEVHGNEEHEVKFCRIIMPDGSTTVVCAKPGQTCRSVLSKLCEKRSISVGNVDVFLVGSDKPLDLSEDISTLGSKEIVIERRILFRLDLPCGKSVGAKAKPNRSILNVLKPILEKYGYSLDHIRLRMTSTTDEIDLDLPVSMLDNQRAAVVSDIPGAPRQRKAPLFGLFRASERRHQWRADVQPAKKC